MKKTDRKVVLTNGGQCEMYLKRVGDIFLADWDEKINGETLVFPRNLDGTDADFGGIYAHRFTPHKESMYTQEQLNNLKPGDLIRIPKEINESWQGDWPFIEYNFNRIVIKHPEYQTGAFELSEWNRLNIPLEVIRPQNIADKAVELIYGDRHHSYGDAKEDFTRAAKIWTAVLSKRLKDGEELDAKDICLCMCSLKLNRECFKHSQDNLVDSIGYLLLLEDIENAC